MKDILLLLKSDVFFFFFFSSVGVSMGPGEIIVGRDERLVERSGEKLFFFNLINFFIIIILTIFFYNFFICLFIFGLLKINKCQIYSEKMEMTFTFVDRDLSGEIWLVRYILNLPFLLS